MKKIALAWLALCLAAAACKEGSPGKDAPPKETVLRVGSFGGLAALPIGVGESKGLYSARGLKIEVEWFRQAEDLIEALASGDVQIAHAPADVIVALVEDKGADGVLVMGGTDGMNELVVRSEVKSVRDLRGKKVLVDPGNPSYELLLRKLLSSVGLEAERDYALAAGGSAEQRIGALKKNPDQAATLLTPPATYLAENEGLKSLGPVVDTLGPYQGMSALVLRPWAQANRAALESYLAAWVEALRSTLAPKNRDEVLAFLHDSMHLEPEVAARTYELLSSGKSGLAPDSRFDETGFRNTLALRAALENRWEGKPPPPERFYDSTYYRAALAQIEKTP
jgi:ABC-type nitrate/sulfonate/bicarbonate transport system substrate-binding protein